MNKDGVFIVIEGTDGSGKGTQFKLLVDRLKLAGYDVATFDFPRYDQPSSYFVKEYLNGKYGSTNEVGPYTASLFYALDRYEAAPQIREALAAGKVVLANRFTGSNMAHQGTKFGHADERRGYFIWLDNLEFEILRIPRPDLNLVLRVPAETAQSLVDKKEARSYTDKKRDIHEADIEHLRRSIDVYDDLCQLFPKDFMRIDCVRSDQLLSIETISNLIWEKVLPLLPKPAQVRHKVQAEATANDAVLEAQAYVKKIARGTEPTEAGEQLLAATLTDTAGPVHVFAASVPQSTVATALGRWAQQNESLQTVLLQEFAHALAIDQQLQPLGAVDTTDQRLLGAHVAFDNVSYLVGRQLRANPALATVQQSTAPYYFDQKNSAGTYKYFVPTNLDETTRAHYCKAMDEQFDRYATMLRQLVHYVRETSTTPTSAQDAAWRQATRATACKAVRACLPVAATLPMATYAPIHALGQVSSTLQASPTTEAKINGTTLARQLEQFTGKPIEISDVPNVPEQLHQLATEALSGSYAAAPSVGVHLTNISPRNELQLVAQALYEHSTVSFAELENVIDAWPYNKKQATLQAHLAARSVAGNLLRQVQYQFDITSSYAAAYDAQLPNATLQTLTPRNGYSIPEIIETTGLADMFECCFDASLQLYSLLQQAGHPTEAQYATLLGHRVRWQVTLTAFEVQQHFRHLPQLSSGTRKLFVEFHEKIAEVHPLIAEVLNVYE